MSTINNSKLLKETIALLEQKQELEFELLKQKALITYENLKPANLIKNTLARTFQLPDIKSTLTNNILGLATGYVTQKLVVKNKDSFSGKILATLINLGVAHLVANNADTLKQWAEQLIDYVSSIASDQDLETDVEENIMPIVE